MADEWQDVSFIVRVKMRRRWAPHFVEMLKYMQKLGGLGSSRYVRFYSDGDGDYRPTFQFDKSFEHVKPVADEDGARTYDAG